MFLLYLWFVYFTKVTSQVILKIKTQYDDTKKQAGEAFEKKKAFLEERKLLTFMDPRNALLTEQQKVLLTT